MSKKGRIFSRFPLEQENEDQGKELMGATDHNSSQKEKELSLHKMNLIPDPWPLALTTTKPLYKLCPLIALSWHPEFQTKITKAQSKKAGLILKLARFSATKEHHKMKQEDATKQLQYST